VTRRYGFSGAGEFVLQFAARYPSLKCICFWHSFPDSNVGWRIDTTATLTRGVLFTNSRSASGDFAASPAGVAPLSSDVSIDWCQDINDRHNGVQE